MDIKLIPQILASLQAKAQLTQVEIAAFIGCNQSTVSDMLNGKRGLVSPTYRVVSGLESLAKKHGIATDSNSPRASRKSPS